VNLRDVLEVWITGCHGVHPHRNTTLAPRQGASQNEEAAP
jgi:hypothetical protein